LGKTSKDKGETKMKNHTLAFLGMFVVVLMALALTIQDAVDTAQHGSRIVVYPEQYEESVTVTTHYHG